MDAKDGHGGFAVLALGDDVQIIGISRGETSKILHTERLSRGETMVANFTDHISAIKIRGSARVFTPYGHYDTID